MYEQIEKSKEDKSRTVANSVGHKKSKERQRFGFVDNRPISVAQRKFQKILYEVQDAELPSGESGVQVNNDNLASAMLTTQFKSKNIKEEEKAIRPNPSNEHVISRYVRPNALSRLTEGFPDNFTISDDGTAATGQRGDQYLYATNARRDEANINLHNAGSPFLVNAHQAGGQFNLANRYGGQTIRRLQIEIDPLAVAPAGVVVDANNVVTQTPADCKRTAERVTGQALHAYGDVTQGAGNLPAIERLVTLARMSNVTVANTEILVERYISYFEANKRAEEFNREYQAHKNDPDQTAVININLPAYQRNPANFDIQVLPVIPSPTQCDDLADLGNYWIGQRNIFLQQLAQLEAGHNLNAAGQVEERKTEKMDKFADPEYGQAYTSLAGGNKVQNQSYWNYHWGGVIMKTQTDNVTFENHASLNDPTRWDVRMYGRPRVVQPPQNAVAPATLQEPKANQSWHETWSESDFGDNPSTFTGR
ncbi:MAG: hypothetical protein MI742_01850 [Desulfobacterales bacterium]|nr:hypothetical protein [Desulfobacterales bacterium]